MARDFAVGVGGILKVSSHADFLITGDLSWACWIKIDSGNEVDDQFVNIGESGESLATNVLLWLNFQGASNAWDFKYIHEYSSGSNESNTFNTNLLNGQWYHISVVRDVSAKTVVFYVDGVVNAIFNYTNDPANSSSTLPYRIGTGIDESSQEKMDDVVIAEVVLSNVAWSSGEVQTVRHRASRARGKVAYHSLFGVSSPEPDYSGNAHNFTVTDTVQADHPPVAPPFGFDQGWQGAFEAVVVSAEVPYQPHYQRAPILAQ